jgi:hypothetical protein
VLLLGLGLSAFFWIPAISDLRYTVFSKTTVSDWRGYFASLPLVGYSTFAVLFVVAMQFISKKIVPSKHRLTTLLFVVCLISIALSTSISFQLWTLLPVGFIQFPFRFLSVTLICIAFLAAWNVSVFHGIKKYILGAGFVIIVVVSMLPFFRSVSITNKDEGYYATNMATTTVADEYMPTWVKEKPLKKPDEKAQVVNGKGIIQNIFSNSNIVNFDLDLQSKSTIRINIIYFPGWVVKVDGIAAPILYNNVKGLIEFSVPTGKHHVQAKFGETQERLLADSISLVSVILLLFLSIKLKKKK